MEEDSVRMLSDEELDNLLVELFMKMNPQQMEKAAEMIIAAKKETETTEVYEAS